MRYQKPSAICRDEPGLVTMDDPISVEDFLHSEVHAVEEGVRSQGLAIRRMQLGDIPHILHFMAELFDEPARQAQREVYKNVRWGGPGNVVALDGNGDVVGFYLCTSYAEGVSLGVMMGVAGRKLALTLERYSFLRTMAIGSKVRHGGVRPDNFKSLHVLFNQMGYVGEEYIASPNPALSRILLTLAQTPAAYYRNRVDPTNLPRYIAEASEGKDWMIVQCEDRRAVQEMYAETPFRVVAYLRSGTIRESDCLLALPTDKLLVADFDRG